MLELQLRVIELIVVLICPICIFLQRYADNACSQAVALIWQALFFECMTIIICVTGRDPITEPTIFEKLIELYLGLWS